MEKAHLGQYYVDNFNPTEFLETYSKDRLKIEPFFCENFFKVFNQGMVKGPRCVDVGGGPTVHRLAYASRLCDQLVHTDLLDQNRDLVREWLNTHELDQKHRHLMKLAAHLEGYEDEEEGAKLIEDRLRSKLVSILPIDIMDEEPIKNLDEHGGLFDCAISHACIESCCVTYEETVQALKNVNRILKPGSALILEGFLNNNYYQVGATTFPSVGWSLEWVQKALKEAGFRLELMEHTNISMYIGTEKDPEDMFFSLSYKK